MKEANAAAVNLVDNVDALLARMQEIRTAQAKFAS